MFMLCGADSQVFRSDVHRMSSLCISKCILVHLDIYIYI